MGLWLKTSPTPIFVFIQREIDESRRLVTRPTSCPICLSVPLSHLSLCAFVLSTFLCLCPIYLSCLCPIYLSVPLSFLPSVSLSYLSIFTIYCLISPSLCTCPICHFILYGVQSVPLCLLSDLPFCILYLVQSDCLCLCPICISVPLSDLYISFPVSLSHLSFCLCITYLVQSVCMCRCPICLSASFSYILSNLSLYTFVLYLP